MSEDKVGVSEDEVGVSEDEVGVSEDEESVRMRVMCTIYSAFQ